MPDPVICDRCGEEGDAATYADWFFHGPENELHEQWLCPPCVEAVEDEWLSYLE